MSDRKSSADAPPVHVDEHLQEDYVDHRPGEPQRPKGWMYKSFKLGPLYSPWYASPRIQLGMVSFVCFMCPGMYNALTGMGGGGKAENMLVDDMNTALYSTFAVVGFFAGTIVNRLGIQLSLSFGGIGYCIYSISLLVSVHADVPEFNVFAGALLGVCAGILWAAQGAIMMSYPNEEKKGSYFAWFWGIFNIGGCIGSLIALGQNLGNTEGTVTDGTYIAFIVLMAFGAVLSLMLVNASKVIRADGSRVVLKQNPSWISELVGLYETIRYEPFVILLFPMFWSSNWFYTYQMNNVNAAYFDTPTRALNSFLYWGAQIVAAAMLGPLLDLKYFRRSVRAKAALFGLFAITMVVWGGGYAWQKGYTRESVDTDNGFEPWNFKHPGYVAPMFMYIFYGWYDAVWQGVVYWLMGAISNSGRRTANMAGFYKGIQSAGAAVMWRIDGDPYYTPFMTELASNWGLLCGSLLVAAPVIFLRIKDHVEIENDVEGTDATAAEMAGHPNEKTISNEP